MKFEDKALSGETTLTEIIPPIFEGVKVANNFISVIFDGQRHPVQIDGTAIGFTFDDVGSEQSN